ncbi:MAG: peroxiredoxin [Betaproteobacteria bacterium]
MATRTGSARWTGELSTGSGQVTVGERAWTGNYSFGSRFEDGAGTNPEELIAAAHAGCFSMALAYILAQAGHSPRVIETTAQVQIRPVDGVPTIAQIDLHTVSDVPGLDEAAFGRLAVRAKESCAVSRALAGVPRISVSAALLGTAPR